MTLQISGAARAVAASVASAGQAPGGVKPSGSLLVQPTEVPPDDMSAIFALMAKGRQLDLRRSVSDIRSAQSARRREWQKAKQALAKALAARRKGGFWSKLASRCGRLAKYAAVAAAVAAAVGTGGAAAPVVVLAWTGAGLSAAACVQGETGALQKLGVSDKWARGIELGMTIGGGVASGGACGWQMAASGESAAQAATSAEKTARVLGAVSGGVSGASSAAAGYATWRAGVAESDALHAEADAAAARGADQLLEQMLLQLLGNLEDDEKAAERTMGALRGAMETKADTLVMISRRV